MKTKTNEANLAGSIGCNAADDIFFLERGEVSAASLRILSSSFLKEDGWSGKKPSGWSMHMYMYVYVRYGEAR